jgi:glutathione reductase (NADPH)
MNPTPHQQEAAQPPAICAAEAPYDLVVIGGGSGGVAAARRAASYGARVALIEQGALGGTCVNVGCVPKKLMWYGAEIAQTLRDAPGYGFHVGATTHDWSALVAARNAVVHRLNEVYGRMLDGAGVTVIRGRALIPEAGFVQVGDRRLRATHTLIATGGRPLRPALSGSELGIDSDGFFELQERPQRVLIIGGGYIAVELAGILASLGSVVTLVGRSARLLPRFDEMIGEAVGAVLREQGVELLLSRKIHALTEQSGALELHLEDGHRVRGFDQVIWATGRSPNVDGLGLEALGVQQQGGIMTDDLDSTNLAGLYAVGDCTGRHLLTPVAIACGRALADRLFGGRPEARVELDLIPTVVFAHPPVGTVGLSEDEARATYGEEIKVYTTRFAPLYYGPLSHRVNTHMKLVCKGTEERILGLHVVGDGADEMLQGFAVALRMGACKRDFDRTIAIHPTGAEEFVTMR